MTRYLETARELQKEVDSFLGLVDWSTQDVSFGLACVQLGHIINLAVRCNPRQPQGTVRKNIVETAMANHCKVSMTKELKDPEEPSKGTYNKIHIVAKELLTMSHLIINLYQCILGSRDERISIIIQWLRQCQNQKVLSDLDDEQLKERISNIIKQGLGR